MISFDRAIDWLPYNWHPSQMYYRIKCWFKRYTTIKPRTMSHTWRDRCELLPHMMFEILSQFIEQECSPGHIEWYGEYGQKIAVDGVEKYVRDEMQEIYDWWYQEYLLAFPEKCKQMWEKAEEIGPQDPMCLFFDGEADEEWRQKEAQYRECLQDISALEHAYDKKRKEMMHRLVNVTPYMWT